MKKVIFLFLIIFSFSLLIGCTEEKAEPVKKEMSQGMKEFLAPGALEDVGKKPHAPTPSNTF